MPTSRISSKGKTRISSPPTRPSGARRRRPPRTKGREDDGEEATSLGGETGTTTGPTRGPGGTIGPHLPGGDPAVRDGTTAAVPVRVPQRGGEGQVRHHPNHATIAENTDISRGVVQAEKRKNRIKPN